MRFTAIGCANNQGLAHIHITSRSRVAHDRLRQPRSMESQRNVDVPDERRLEFCIGITLSNVFIRDDDIFSDGVDIAGDQG